MPEDVYSVRDIAAASGVSDAWVESLLARGEIRSVASLCGSPPADPALARYVPHDEAVRVVRALVAGSPVALPSTGGGLGRELFGEAPQTSRSSVPLVVSTSIHGFVAASVLFLASLGLAADQPTEPLAEPEPVRLVFMVSPGAGGGGGGGGLRQRAPAPKVERKGASAINSPVPARRLPPPIEPKPRVVEPPPAPLEARTLPPVMAPVVTRPADERDREGVVEKVEQPEPSQGSGSGGGAGTGSGTGLGEGDGAGIGDGSGGGTGGGPYRPGSGVSPPGLLREVRADYSNEARRANLEGEVLLEIVITSKGTVGDVRVLEGLGLGLDEKAVEAVRQWRFSPARMKGTPVDVIVEVTVEFRLR